ncbi:MAG TPA: DUF3341 domain-containing protein [Humisphaera sp.]
MSDATTVTTAHHHHDAPAPLFGVMAEFENEADCVAGARRMYELGYRQMDGYTPFPVHGLDDAIGRRRTRLPYLVFGAGLTGAVAGFMMQAATAAELYQVNIAGRPYVAWPMFVPITFELTILLASLTAVFAMIGLNGLPQPYHPVFNVPSFERASSHAFFVCVESTDPAFDAEKVKADFANTPAKAVHEVPE